MVFVSSDWVYCVAFDPQKPNILASGSRDKTIKIWDIESGACQSTLGHTMDNPECKCTFYSDGVLQKRNSECPVTGHSDW